MPFQTRMKPWSKAPFDHNGGLQTGQWMDWVTTALNQLSGQGQAPPGTGLQSLQTNIIDPTSATITSAGSRMSSVSTDIKWVAQVTGGNATVTFYWDGSNGSQPLRIGRDDGTIVGPTTAGSPQLVSGLLANTTYYFYPWWEESQSAVRWGTVPGVAIGTPAYAFTVQNFAAAQQQILRGRVPLGLLLVSTGVTTPGSGTSSGSGGSGGGGAGSGGGRGPLQ